MQALVKKGAVPEQTVVPAPIELEGIWGLDVDDNIWQDTGLLDDDREGDGDLAPPCWSADEDVRNGIRHMLEIDRCTEEMARIQKERTTLQEWLRDEWAAVSWALERYGVLFCIPTDSVADA